MNSPPAEGTTARAALVPAPGTPDGAAVVRRLPGRNRTKADVTVYRTTGGDLVAVKDYTLRPWWVRHSLGRLLVARECRAYAIAEGLAGLPRFLGRRGRFALAVEWIDALPLARFENGSVPPERFERLSAVVEGLHARGLALADLHYRDVLLGNDGRVWVVDLAAACTLGPRPGRLRRTLFEHFRKADHFAIARLRARFAGEDAAAAVAAADPAVRRWHRRARRAKWIWDRLRGAERLAPVDDHWRFGAAREDGYDTRLAALRRACVLALAGVVVAFAQPTPARIAAGGLPLVLGEALRVWAAGHLVKNDTLVTSGPYRYLRNPLYLGRLSIFTGLCLMCPLPRGLHWLVLLAGWLVFFGYYLPRKERVEPARLRALHGEAYERYRREVPSLLPRPTPWPPAAAGRWSAARALGNREHWMVAALAGIAAWLLWRAYSG
jgi:protein-S-isoprenylcysteine O-methyltransferase Ste14